MSGGGAERSLLAAWSLASPTLLWWALAGLLPLLIHLWNRRRYEEQPWAAMAFLLAALRQHARRLWLEQWLLLALRVLILLLFALALAEPQFDGGAAAVTSRLPTPATHLVVVLDVSFSMDQQAGGRTALERARQQVAALVGQSPQGDGFSLVLLGDPPRVAIGDPAFERRVMLEELEAARTAPRGADLPGTLREVERVVVEARRRFPRLHRARVICCSDLARHTWDTATSPAVLELWNRLGELGSVELLDVGSDQVTQLAVTGLRTSEPQLVVGGEVRLAATVRNFGLKNVTALPVEFQWDGQLLGVATIDVPAGSEAVATLATRCESPGDHIAVAALPADDLPRDDRRWLSVSATGPPRVLCVEGKLDEARYLAVALAPDRQDVAAPRVTVAAEASLLDRALSAFDLVALCNVSRLASAETAVLRDYVAQGGRLALFLGDQVQVENYNAELGAATGVARAPDGASSPPPGETGELRRLLPARLGPPAAVRAYRLDPRDYRDPVVAPFRGQERAGLLSTPVWCYLSTTPFPGTPAQTVLALDTGDPLVLRERRGKGEVWLITTAASPRSLARSTDPPTPWTAWATWPSFVPFIQQLLRESLAARSELRNVLVGQALSGQFPRGMGSEEVIVDAPPAPDVRPQAAETQRRDYELVWTFAATDEAGVYQVRRNADPAHDQRFAVNLDPRESDLERLDPQTLPAVLRRETARAASGSRSPAGATRHLFRHVLAVVVGLLAMELTLAWWLGRRRGSVVAVQPLR
ncbi:MAG: VWA domain-containing protein [Pirellulales bacterium]